MKKLWTPVIAVALAVGVSATSLAAQWKTAYDGLLTKPMEATMTSVTDLGADFLVSNEAAPASDTADAAKAVTDGDETTTWDATQKGDHLQINFDGLKLINVIHIYENGSGVGNYIETGVYDDNDDLVDIVSKPPFVIEAWNGAEWVEVYEIDALRDYHVCAIDPIQTNAIRLSVHAFSNSKNPKVSIGEVLATYQPPVQREDPFLNVGYSGKNGWLTRFNSIPSEALDSLDDLILIETFSWARYDADDSRSVYDGRTTGDGDFKAGSFVFQVPQPGGRMDHYADPFSTEVDEQMKKAAISLVTWHEKKIQTSADGTVTYNYGEPTYEDALEYLHSEEAPRIWICLTGGDWGKDNNDPQAHAMFNDPTVLDKFTTDVVNFVKKYDWIYGVDIDWEYPQNPTQCNALGQMVVQLKQKGIPEVSAAVSPSYGYTQEMKDNLDRLNIMSYMTAQDNVHTSMNQMAEQINTYVNKGWALNKIVVGVPYYGINANGSITEPLPLSFGTLYSTYMGSHSTFPTGMNSIESGIRFVINSPQMLKDKVAWCALRGVKGVFNWQQINDLQAYNPGETFNSENGDASLARAVAEAIDEFIVNPAE